MSPLLAILLLAAAASGAGIVFTRNPIRLVVAISANGLVLSLLFMALQAPDVAFSEIAVGTAAVPLLFLATLAAIRINTERRKARE